MSFSVETIESYFEQRLSQLGVSAQDNQVMIWRSAENGGNELQPVPVFRESEKGIDILVYSLSRNIIQYKPDGSRWSKDYCLTRLKDPIVKRDGSSQKYSIPKGQGTYPFFHPWLIDLYEKKEPIEALYLVEGYFKAWKGCMHGIPVVGLSSITHMKDRDKGTLHPDILALMKTCRVKRMVWITDGDCLDITSKELTDGIDLYKRPMGFFGSCGQFKQLLDDFDVDKYFVHIDTDNILQMYSSLTRDKVKGLDDLLITMGMLDEKYIDEVRADLMTVSRAGDYFQKFNITYGLSKVHKHFHLSNVNEFYHYHSERRKELKSVEFVFHGTKYRFDESQNECKIVAPGEAKDYFRTGDQFYKFVYIPNKYGQLERTYHRRQRSTIVEDHGKDLIKHIPKYEAFCSVPDHQNYQQVISNCFNVYSPFEHEPEQDECSEADCPTIIAFLKHIFGTGQIAYSNPKTKTKQTLNQWDLGLDYFQLLFKNPTQKLPILCLVSRENETGKSTLAMLLKLIFTGNCAIVGNAELSDNFNASWCTKLIVICDEAKIDKQIVVEKVKSLSMGDKIMMNAKGKDHVELDFYGKFLFLTNFEDSFIYATDEDLRFWIIKVPRITEKNPDLLINMKDEIPAFLSFLSKRKMITERITRMWFDPVLLKTEALKKVILASQPTIEKELRQYFRDAFRDFGCDQIMMTLSAVHEEVFKGKYERNYLENVLKERLKVELYHVFLYKHKHFPTLAEAEAAAVSDNPGIAELELARLVTRKYTVCRHRYPKWDKMHREGKPERVVVDVSDIGRPYIFKRDQFLSQEEIESTLLDPEIADLYSSSNVNGVPNHTSGQKKHSDELPF
jgi:hypothetical protein